MGKSVGLIKLASMARTLATPDTDHFTAYGASPNLKEEWLIKGKAQDPRVKWYNSTNQLPKMPSEPTLLLLEFYAKLQLKSVKSRRTYETLHCS